MVTQHLVCALIVKLAVVNAKAFHHVPAAYQTIIYIMVTVFQIVQLEPTRLLINATIVVLDAIFAHQSHPALCV